MYLQMYAPCMKRCCGFAVMNEQERYDYRFWDAKQELEPLRYFLREQTVKTWEKQIARTENAPKG